MVTADLYKGQVDRDSILVEIIKALGESKERDIQLLIAPLLPSASSESDTSPPLRLFPLSLSTVIHSLSVCKDIGATVEDAQLTTQDLEGDEAEFVEVIVHL